MALDHGSNSSGSANGKDKEAVIASKRANRKKMQDRSLVWEHFKKEVGEDGVLQTAICKYCKLKYQCHSKKNGTSTLWAHINKCSLRPSKIKKKSVFKSKPDSTPKSKSPRKNQSTLPYAWGRKENTELQQTPCNGASISIQDKTSTVFTVKAKYKEYNIKFNFSKTSNFDQLKEEVGGRLNLDASNYKITYIDGDGDSVLITGDSDLQLYLHDLEQSKTNNMRLFIDVNG